ncbi:Inositol monophosphatase 3 [Bienertia sinuspersici]
MEEKELDFVLVSLGLLVFGVYHIWLVITVKRNPRNTVIGINAESRSQWIISLMADPVKNGVLMVQTFRNNMMASTLLATTAITLSSIIGVFVSSTSSNVSSRLVFGNKSEIISSVKYFALILCFLVAFLCNVQSIRYYAHVSFLATLPTSQGKKEAVEYAARSLNRGSFCWSLGLRAFYLSFPLYLWIFGPIPMFGCCCLMSIVLYFLDTTNSFTRQLHCESFKENDNKGVLPPAYA